jgi:hypothetical protein
MKLQKRLKQLQGKQIQVYLDSDHDLIGELIEVNKDEIILRHEKRKAKDPVYVSYIPVDSIEGITVSKNEK